MQTSNLHWYSVQAQELAAVLHLMERYDDAAQSYADAIDASRQLGGKAPPIPSYNRACALACAGRDDEALKALDTALSMGVDDLTREWVAEDGDLRSLHDKPEFKRILKKYFGE